MTVPSRIVPSVTCLGCGCACDDIRLTIRDDRIVEAGNACSLGESWFGDGRVPCRALVGGRESSVLEAIDAAAALLSSSERALVYLAPGLTCEAQRQAVALADMLGATVDSVTSATVLNAVLASQERGRATATLGEIRHRADLVVWWGVDPAARYPRYATRYAPLASGMHVGSRASRTVVAVDVGEGCGPADADLRVTVAPVDEVDTLRALSGAIETGDTAASAGSRVPAADELARIIRSARYVAVVADAEPDPRAGSPAAHRADALVAMSQALNGPTRGALSLLRAGGNRSGADAVLTWQTGYPVAVDFSRGSPRYRPHDGSAGARLSRGEVDAALVVGEAGLIPDALIGHLTSVPVAVAGPRASASALASGIAVIDTGIAGVHDAGTALRMDDVPVRLRAVIDGVPLTQSITRALSERIVARQRTAGQAPGAGGPR